MPMITANSFESETLRMSTYQEMLIPHMWVLTCLLSRFRALKGHQRLVWLAQALGLAWDEPMLVGIDK